MKAVKQAAQGEIDVLTAPFTVVLTSCRRFHLLERTVGSLLATLDERPAAFIVIEDSGDRQVLDVLVPFEDALGRPFTVILNERQLGQMRSIDRAYAQVETPLLFHCEDDWEFVRTGYLTESRRLLASLPQVSMVGLRDRSDLNPRVRHTVVSYLKDDHGEPLGYMPLDPRAHPEYFSYSFNPGLRRMSDLEDVGSLAEIGYEEDVSYAFKRRGFQMANLASCAVRHLGDEEHVADPTARAKAKTPAQRLARSARKRVKRVARSLLG